MSADADFSIVALVVSLIALVFTLGQLLQQIFSTADGYRRCQSSIIGPWAKFTDLDWRWRQFRFETKFTTPDIVLYNDNLRPLRRTSGPGTGIKYDPSLRDVHDLAEVVMPVDQHLYSLPSGQLEETDKMPAQISPETAYGLKIGIKYRERTWDLMPADMIRPTASTTLGTLLVLARRLGMNWENVDIKEGNLRATGNGQTLISTTIPGLGICFQYTYNSPDKLKQFSHYNTPLSSLNNRARYEKAHEKIRSWATELLSFGYVPGVPRLDVPPVPIESETVVEASKALATFLYQIGADNSTVLATTDLWQIEQLRKPTGGGVTASAFVVNDLIALSSDFLPVPGSTAVSIFWPFRMGGPALSAFLYKECRAVLVHHLGECVDAHPQSSQLEKVLEKMKTLEQKYHDDFYCNWHRAKLVDADLSNQGKLTFLDELRQIHDTTTEYFVEFQKVISYTELLGAHANLACRSAFEARGIPDNEGFWRRTAELYVNNLGTLVSDLKGKVQPGTIAGENIEMMLEEAWWTLILRGLAWRMSVSTWPSDYLAVIPSRFYDDPTPVYIL